jgi:predicted extracellular nuclease
MSHSRLKVGLFLIGLVVLLSGRVFAQAGGIYINELWINPSGTDNGLEFVELRGTASAAVPTDLYFVAVEGDGTSAGTVDLVWQVANNAANFGSNGFIVRRDSSTVYWTDARVGAGTATVTLDFSPDIENGTNTFLLIRTATAPVVGTTDIDSDNNGVPDGTAYAGWTIVDSVANIENDTGANFGYGAIAFRGSVATGTNTGTLVTMGTDFTADYLMRQGNSTGSTAADWVAGDVEGNTTDGFSLEAADVEPALYGAEALDHLGATNPLGTPPTGAPEVIGLIDGISAVFGDSTQPSYTGAGSGFDFTVQDDVTSADSLTVTVNNGNAAVLTSAAVIDTGVGSWRLDIGAPAGAVGYSTVTVTVTDGDLNETDFAFIYAASLFDAARPNARYYIQMADASTGVALPSDRFLTLNDEDQVVRIYNSAASGAPFDTDATYTPTSGAPLFLDGSGREVDFEATTAITTGDTVRVFAMGSHSNASSGSDRPNRERVLAFDYDTVSGTVTPVGFYRFLEDDLIAWDNANGHGLGAGFFGLAASAAAGVVPETIDGFNIEGLTFAPGSTTTAYVAFRAPNVPPVGRTLALIVPVTNFNTLATSSDLTAGSATFGAPIQLDLGGRGIRSIECSATACLIVAGSATGSENFKLYTWTGSPSDLPESRSADLTGLNPEGIASAIPASFTDTTEVALISDNGDNIWYNDGIIAKDLPIENHRKFRVDFVQIGAVDTSAVCGAGPFVVSPLRTIPSMQENGAFFGETGSFRFDGIVTGDFQLSTQLNGFFMQDAAGDLDVLTSDGIFVSDPQPPLLEVTVGQRVRVIGTVSEAFGRTILTATSITDCQETGTIVPTSVILPFSSATEPERYESMLVTFPTQLTVSDHFNLGRFGEVVLSNGRIYQPTNIVEPGAPAVAQAAANALNRIILDDLRDGELGATDLTPYLFGTPPTIRLGDTTINVTGIMDFGFSSFRIRPTAAPVFTRSNPRPPAPDVGGDLIVLSYNVLNYFNGNGLGRGFPTPRGATNLAEFNEQRNKIIAALDAMDADILGLIEMENDGGGANSAIEDLVNGLNTVAGAGTYSYINTGLLGTDEITVAFIYKSASVTPVGAFMADTSSVHNRPPLAQTFQDNLTGEIFSVVVNHFKSKGCDGSTGLDQDQGDGQSCFNLTRVNQANALLTFINDIVIPTSGDPDVMIIGDLNAYLLEDPIDVLTGAGYVNLIADGTSYSFLFFGQIGSLDHALVTPSMVSQVTGADKWHTNADEPVFMDYNNTDSTGGNPNETNEQIGLEVGTPWRASDHDPILIGLSLSSSVGIEFTTIDAAAGLVITDELTHVAEGATVGDQFSFRLTAQPSANTTITVAVSDTAQLRVDDSLTSGITPVTSYEITFEPSNTSGSIPDWDQWVIVNVIGVEDNVEEADPQAFSVTLTGSEVVSVPVEVFDTAVNIGALPRLQEGGTGSYTVVLNAPPGLATGSTTETISLSLISYNTRLVVPTPTSLSFTRANWSVPQTINLVIPDDAIDRGTSYAVSITHQPRTNAVAPFDSRYGGTGINIAAPRQRAWIADNDLVEGEALTEAQYAARNLAAWLDIAVVNTIIAEGSSQTALGVRLAGEPPEGEIVIVRLYSEVGVMLTPAELVFTAQNWSIYQMITLSLPIDEVMQGLRTVAVQVVVSDGTTFADSLGAADAVLVNVVDAGAGFALPETPAEVFTPVPEAGGETPTGEGTTSE